MGFVAEIREYLKNECTHLWVDVHKNKVPTKWLEEHPGQWIQQCASCGKAVRVTQSHISDQCEHDWQECSQNQITLACQCRLLDTGCWLEMCSKCQTYRMYHRETGAVGNFTPPWRGV